MTDKIEPKYLDYFTGMNPGQIHNELEAIQTNLEGSKAFLADAQSEFLSDPSDANSAKLDDIRSKQTEFLKFNEAGCQLLGRDPNGVTPSKPPPSAKKASPLLIWVTLPFSLSPKVRDYLDEKFGKEPPADGKKLKFRQTTPGKVVMGGVAALVFWFSVDNQRDKKADLDPNDPTEQLTNAPELTPQELDEFCALDVGMPTVLGELAVVENSSLEGTNVEGAEQQLEEDVAMLADPEQGGCTQEDIDGALAEGQAYIDEVVVGFNLGEYEGAPEVVACEGGKVVDGAQEVGANCPAYVLNPGEISVVDGQGTKPDTVAFGR